MVTPKFVTVKPEEGVLPSHLNLLCLKKFFAGLPDGVVYVQRRPSGEILMKIRPGADHLVESLREVHHIGDAPVSFHVPIELNLVMGVISHAEIVHMTEGEIKELLEDQGVTYVRKVSQGAGETAVLGWAPSADTVTLPPPTVVLWLDTVVVRPYVPRPTRCHHCQRYGHIAAKCTAPAPVCSRCAGSGHQVDGCTDDHPTCPACGGPHAASDSTCPVWLEERAIAKIKHRDGLSYADALKQRRAHLQETQPEDPVEEPTQQEDDDRAPDDEPTPEDQDRQAPEEDQASDIDVDVEDTQEDIQVSQEAQMDQDHDEVGQGAVAMASSQPDTTQEELQEDGFQAVKRSGKTLEQEEGRRKRRALRRVKKEEDKKKKEEEERRRLEPPTEEERYARFLHRQEKDKKEWEAIKKLPQYTESKRWPS